MVQRRFRQSNPPPRLRGDNPVFWAAFARAWDMDPRFMVGRRLSPGTTRVYVEWLRERGIEPETGKMTDEGLAFFKELLDADNDRRKGRNAR